MNDNLEPTSQHQELVDIFVDVTEFSNWLLQELNKRDWSQADLARASDLSRQAVSNYIAGRINKPDEAALKALARAFGYPPETVFRAAGVLPEQTKKDELTARAVHLFEMLDDWDREDVIVYMETRLAIKERRNAISDLRARLSSIPPERSNEILDLFDEWFETNKITRKGRR